MNVYKKIKFQKNDIIVKKYKFMGITLLRKERLANKKKYIFLGMKFSRNTPFSFVKDIKLWLQKKFSNKYKGKSEDYILLATSKYFNTRWYLKQYPDVAKARLDPIEHYLKYGWKEGRIPSEKFDGNLYLTRYQDVKNAKVNPLVHYLKNGIKEKRKCSLPIHSYSSYIASTPNLKDYIIRIFKNKTPKISIIVASYNYADLIKETLNSLIAQTYTNFEVIVVDDGSKDDSIQVIEKYTEKYPFIKLYTHEGNSNKGLPATIKLGIEKSTGEYIAFCESDDMWTERCLEKRIEFINKYADVQILSNNVTLFGEKNSAYENHIAYIENTLQRGRNYINLNKNIFFNYIPTFSSVMIKHSILQTIDYNSTIPAWIDFWVYRQILCKYPLYHMSEQLTKWRLHNSYNCLARSSKYAENKIDFIEQNNALITQKRKYDINNYEYQLLKKSSYFNSKWYARQYNIPSNEDPIVHYMTIGYKENYSPSKDFSGEGYCHFYIDINSKYINPLIHYLKYGKAEGRKVFPIEFSPIIYQSAHQVSPVNNILLVSHMLNHTGAPMLLLSLANLLKENGFNIYVLSPQDGDLREEFIKSECTVIIDPCIYYSDKQFDKYRKYNFKFCVCNTYVCTSCYNIIKKHIPSILWIHDNISENMARLLDVILHNSNNVYVPSKLTQTYIAKCNKDPKLLSYPIKDVAKFKPQKVVNQKLRIAICATIHKRKGQDIFIQAIKEIPESIRKNGEFLIVGENSDNKLMKNLKKEGRHIKQLKFIPCIKNFSKYHKFMDSIDVLCCPSREDPYPLVVIDAMMHGKPVIISDHVGQKDLIQNNKNGFVFKSEDSQALAKILAKILQKGISEELQRKSRQVFKKNFEYQNYLKNFKKIMERTCVE